MKGRFQQMNIKGQLLPKPSAMRATHFSMYTFHAVYIWFSLAVHLQLEHSSSCHSQYIP